MSTPEGGAPGPPGPPATPGPTAPPAGPRTAPGWGAGRIIGMVAGCILAFVGLLVLIAGLALVLVHAEGRDSDGFYTTGTERLGTRTYALTVEDIDLGSDAADLVPKDILGSVRIRAERLTGRPVFVGVAPERDVDRYLRGVAHAEVEGLDPAEYRTTAGGAPRRPPGREQFWVASAEGPGRQAATWDVEGGQWAVVAMNADARRGVAVDADVGAKVGWLLGVGIGLLVGGLLIAAGGAVLIALAARGPRRASG